MPTGLPNDPSGGYGHGPQPDPGPPSIPRRPPNSPFPGRRDPTNDPAYIAYQDRARNLRTGGELFYPREFDALFPQQASIRDRNIANRDSVVRQYYGGDFLRALLDPNAGVELQRRGLQDDPNALPNIPQYQNFAGSPFPSLAGTTTGAGVFREPPLGNQFGAFPQLDQNSGNSQFQFGFPGQSNYGNPYGGLENFNPYGNARYLGNFLYGSGIPSWLRRYGQQRQGYF